MADISDRAYRQGLALAFLVVFALSATDPTSRSDWALENLLVLGAAVALWQVRETVPFPRLASTSIFLFLCAHEIGAHYTYPAVPYDRWLQASTGHSLQELFGLRRNHYDRFVHTLFGLLLTVPFREVLLRTSPVRGRWSYVLPVAIVMALSAGYEICEWIAGVTVGGNLGDAFLGAQGDPWDSQEDMACAAVGAMVAASLLRWHHSRAEARHAARDPHRGGRVAAPSRATALAAYGLPGPPGERAPAARASSSVSRARSV